MKLNRNGNAILTVLITLGVLLTIAVIGLTWYWSVINAEVGLRNQIAAKQTANEVELDTMVKTITQSAQVTTAQAEALKSVVTANADARTNPGSGSLATLVRESIPNLDQSTFKTLMNIIAGTRSSFAARQTEILNMKKEHDDLRLKAPSRWLVGDKPEITVVVVTSTRAKGSFATGLDDDTDLFPKAK